MEGAVRGGQPLPRLALFANGQLQLLCTVTIHQVHVVTLPYKY